MLDRAKQMHLYHVLELNQSSNGKGYLLVSSYHFRNASPTLGVSRGRNAPVPRREQRRPQQRTYSGINTIKP